MPAPSSVYALTPPQARLLGEAAELIRAGNWHGAHELALSLTETAPTAADAHHLLAICRAENGQFELAQASFSRALELAPDHPLVLLNYGAMLRKAGSLKQAVDCFHRCTDLDPTLAKAWLELGNAELELGRLGAALVALNRAIEVQPGSLHAWHSLGNACRASGDDAAAESAFQRALALAPEYGPAWVNLGISKRSLGRPDAALACYASARSCGLDVPELADAESGALLDVGRVEDALSSAKQLVRRFPGFVPGHVTLANLLWEFALDSALDADALAPFRTAVQQQPGHAQLRLGFARFLLSANRPEEALGHVRALRAQADDVSLISLEADVLEAIGLSEQAGTLYRQLLPLQGGRDPAFLNAYARHLLRIGRWDAAEARASEAIRLDPDNQASWAYLATAWRLLGDSKEAWLCGYEQLIDLIEVPIPDQFFSREEFLSALAATLEPLHIAKREPVQQSVRGGSQTPGRLFGRNNALLLASQSALVRAVESWLARLPEDARHPFLGRKAGSVRMSGSWSVKLWTSGNHANHFHPQGWMSSAFYVALPPSVGTVSGGTRHAGCIQFGQPPAELGLNLEPRRIIVPRPGTLALFPSYLWHGTVPFHDAQPRVSIAFDMIPASRPFE